MFLGILSLELLFTICGLPTFCMHLAIVLAPYTWNMGNIWRPNRKAFQCGSYTKQNLAM